MKREIYLLLGDVPAKGRSPGLLVDTSVDPEW